MCDFVYDHDADDVLAKKIGSLQIRVKPAMIRAHSRVKKHMGMSKKADK